MSANQDTGYQILEAIANAGRFNHWMYETIQPYCHGGILEIGSGIGNISQFFVADGRIITLSDPEDFYIDLLKNRFRNTAVISIDLVHKSFETRYNKLFNAFDTVFLLNVLEHIENDSLAIENCRRFLKPGGSLVILVPAYRFLFSKIDQGLHHYRRYTLRSISTLASRQNFNVSKSFYFNAFGIFGWAYGKVFGLTSISSWKMKTFDRFVPFAKRLDKLLLRKLGLSIILVAEKSP